MIFWSIAASIEEIQEIGEHFCAAFYALLERLFYAAGH
jgi:hypothetical protein